METKESEPAEAAWKGIELCRQGDWKEGLYWLSLAAETDEDQGNLPALFYSYLGYGVARYQKQEQQGLSLCRRAIGLELYQPETYYFLARTHLLVGDRRKAYEVAERGLRIDSAHPGLTELRAELGERRPPVLPFLTRRHPFNRWLGLLRHRLLRRHRQSGSAAER